MTRLNDGGLQNQKALPGFFLSLLPDIWSCRTNSINLSERNTCIRCCINNIGYGRTRSFTSTLQATFQLSQFRQGTRARGIRVCTTHAILDAKILNMQKGTRLDWYQIKPRMHEDTRQMRQQILCNFGFWRNMLVFLRFAVWKTSRLGF